MSPPTTVKRYQLGLIICLPAGLIIISAHYGLATAFTSTGLREVKGQEHKVVDVTVPVQALVNGGKLQISGGRGKVRDGDY